MGRFQLLKTGQFSSVCLCVIGQIDSIYVYDLLYYIYVVTFQTILYMIRLLIS